MGDCGVTSAVAMPRVTADQSLARVLTPSTFSQIMSDSGADFALTFRNLWRVDSLSDQVCIERFLAWLLPNLPAPSQMAHGCRPLMPAAQLRTLIEMAGTQGGLGGTRFNMEMVMREVSLHPTSYIRFAKTITVRNSWSRRGPRLVVGQSGGLTRLNLNLGFRV